MSEDMNRNEKRVKAVAAIGKLVGTGKLRPAKQRVCQDCDGLACHYHHPDYDRQLYVVPLCRHCHAKRHWKANRHKVYKPAIQDYITQAILEGRTDLQREPLEPSGIGHETG